MESIIIMIICFDVLKICQNGLNVNLVVFISLRTWTSWIWEFTSLIHQLWNTLSHHFFEYYFFSPFVIYVSSPLFHIFISLCCFLCISIPVYHVFSLALLNLWFNLSVEVLALKVFFSFLELFFLFDLFFFFLSVRAKWLKKKNIGMWRPESGRMTSRFPSTMVR